MAAQSGRFAELGREPLDSTVNADVLPGDAALRQQLFKIAAGQPIPQVPATWPRIGRPRRAGRPEPDKATRLKARSSQAGAAA